MRYIDAEKIKITADTMIADGECYVPLAAVKQAIAQAPTEEVQKVIHARWITKDLDNFRKVECKCSECCYIGISNYDSYDDPYDFNLCPNCGAKMDGEREEGTDNG